MGYALEGLEAGLEEEEGFGPVVDGGAGCSWCWSVDASDEA